MRNLVIILISLFPFIGLSQPTASEENHSNSKMYLESGIDPFLEIYDEKQPAKVVATLTTVKINHQRLSQFELNNDECRTTRMYDNPKVYFKIGEEMAFAKINRNSSTEVAIHGEGTPVDQKFILPVYNEDDYKLGFLNSNEKLATPLKTFADDSITIRVYDNPKVFYEIKVPVDSEKMLFTINHQHH